jgi:hypothetical protein
MIEDTQFFEHGRVDLIGVDKQNRRAIFAISIPYVLLVRVLPAILAGGSISGIQVASPLSVWQVKITNADIKEEFLRGSVDVAPVIWNALNRQLNIFLSYYVELCQILKDPHIVNHSLPMGTYVSMNLTCDVDKVPGMLLVLQQSIAIEGVAEFQFALSAALAKAITAIN